jgi:hypothetical protein
VDLSGSRKVEKIKIFDSAEELDAFSQAGKLSLQPKLLHLKKEYIWNIDFFGLEKLG